ncbi:MAG: hypothetical protein H8D82_02010 [Euryarchaeota archaeon]|nr:hypothetical protein [Euryarchaeota archaeon]
MERRSADVSLSEFAERLKTIGVVVGLLIIAELFYRWFTYPDDSFVLYQELLTWVWFNIHSLIFGAETVSYFPTEGPQTILQFSHNSLTGSGMSPLEVTDECVGLHEIAFVSFLIGMTPGISKKMKLKGILTMAFVLALLNLARLLILYPLAVKGCQTNPGQYGCWAPMWEFHQFMLDVGFMLIIVIGWTGWLLAVGGPKKVRAVGNNRLPVNIPKKIKLRQNHTLKSYSIIAIALILLSSASYTLAFDELSQTEKTEAEGCEGVISSLCAYEIREWENISGRAYRLLFVSGVLAFFGFSEFRWRTETEPPEEE